jgi:hypothetical protein
MFRPKLNQKSLKMAENKKRKDRQAQEEFRLYLEEKELRE